MLDKSQIQVKKINSNETKDFILNKHYAHRMPSISYAYGLFIKEELQGVLTIGKPASNSLCEGVLGKEYKHIVFELNRLVINDGLPKNILSMFVGKVLKCLTKENLVLISYADEAMNHKGYIYQATNWLYTGKTKDRTDKYVPNGKHSRHYTNEYDHLRKYRSSKYRYIYFTNKKTKKELIGKLKYPIIKEYPKGNTEKYDFGNKLKQKIINKKTGEIFYE